jgi:hypothetical protein
MITVLVGYEYGVQRLDSLPDCGEALRDLTAA